MFLVYTNYETPRLKYVLNEILYHRFGFEVKITENIDYFLKSGSLKINYSNQIIESCVNVPAVNLLFEDEIFKHEIAVEESAEWNKVFFKKEFEELPDFRHQTEFLNFDIFAASFFLLSRYEEYYTTKKDKYGRYMPENSLAFRNNFLQFPLVDYWIEKFKQIIKKQYPHISIPEPKFKHINSIDLDFPYKYKGLGIYRNFKKFAGSIVRRDWKEILLQKRVLLNQTNDPFDSYDYIISKDIASDSDLYFFFLLSNKEGRHDKNQSPKSEVMKNLAAKLKKDFHCGLHPSYASSFSEKLLIKESHNYQNLFKDDVKRSRFHFLKVQIPKSYINLSKHSINSDFSLGYASHPGFRASTCHPFHFFNVQNSEASVLKIYPVTVMDVTLKCEMMLDADSAIMELAKLKKVVKDYDGLFISIWHNDSVSDYGLWVGWRKVYESMFS